ncbi:MAG TPA: DNA translocase FtsK [Acidobacteriaceae bacterium]|nr:DNA translocase FtsK [Acidobacteriaceae bacterium]
MKPIRIVKTPTRNRPLNLLLGALLLLASALLLLSLATYHATDPSLDTASGAVGPHVVRNWIGPTGAYLSDGLFQVFGLTAFGLPLWIGGLGLAWVRSRDNGSAWLRWTGVVLTLAFLPTLFGLLPWGWHWLHAVSVEGTVGRLIADALTLAVNRTGAWIIAGVAAGAGLYLGSNFSFRSAWEWSQARSIQLTAVHDRYRNWQADRADKRAESEAIRRAEAGLADDDEEEEEERAPGFFARIFGKFRRGRREPEMDLDEVPAFERMRRRREDGEEAEAGPLRQNVPNIWERRSGYETPQPAGAHAVTPHGVTHYQQRVEEPAQEEHEEVVPISARVQESRAGRLETRPAMRGEIRPETRNDRRPDTRNAAQEAWAEAAAQTEVLQMPWRGQAQETAEEEVAEGMEEQHFEMPAAPMRPVAVPPAPRSRPAAPPQRREEQLAEKVTVHERADADLRTVTLAPKRVDNFRLPPSTLLTAGEEPLAIREDMLREEARKLVEKCAEFKVNGQVVQINPGPMVTTYEFKPDASVKYSRVAGLGDDLCLAMRAESILIERMAGKSTIGIQVPNHDRETIHLRDVIESETFGKAKSRLALAMGKDINGRVVTADLASMPHVLIAGSTGSGKSVAINAMITSLLFRTTPEQVRLILVDPKRVELGMYEGIPHLFTPIITEAKLAANALRNAVREMERRLKLLASRSVRNIDQYNAKVTEGGMASLFTDDGQEEHPLPYIVIIIDELADLMMLDRANVEESITRLAQMARAVGIHLILATQRPSVDVITGLIKANVPTRISFRLASKVDSRTIIDDNGAESLLGRGDMLFRPPGTSRLMRLHAPYVSEHETSAVVEFWKAQGEAEYAEGFLEAPRDEKIRIESGEDGENENDELFDDAVRLVFEFGKASTSLLQRRLRIGYGRAAHLIDLMERDGLVGPADGSRPRELLKHPGWLHEVSAEVE